MPLSPPLHRQVEEALAAHGANTIAGVVPTSGGCINNGARIDTNTGAVFFLKWNSTAPPEMFAAEADGLLALRAAGTIRVPRPLDWGGGDDAPPWLLMEYIAAGTNSDDYPERLGTSLAQLHDTEGDPRFGWSRDNWIGALDQANRESDSWADFWRDLRIVPQLELARSKGFLRSDALDRLVEAIPRALVGVESGQLLHGDLWGGNAYAGSEGEPVLIDPAVYRGDGEVDLAMTELFGGFGRGFYEAYDAHRPISAGYESHRRDLYQLYYLLVHVNLFGASYERGSFAAAERVVSALG